MLYGAHQDRGRVKICTIGGRGQPPGLRPPLSSPTGSFPPPQRPGAPKTIDAIEGPRKARVDAGPVTAGEGKTRPGGPRRGPEGARPRRGRAGPEGPGDARQGSGAGVQTRRGRARQGANCAVPRPQGRRGPEKAPSPPLKIDFRSGPQGRGGGGVRGGEGASARQADVAGWDVVGCAMRQNGISSAGVAYHAHLEAFASARACSRWAFSRRMAAMSVMPMFM